MQSLVCTDSCAIPTCTTFVHGALAALLLIARLCADSRPATACCTGLGAIAHSGGQAACHKGQVAYLSVANSTFNASTQTHFVFLYCYYHKLVFTESVLFWCSRTVSAM